MKMKDNIGKTSEKVKNIVERGAVKKFAESIKDEHPLFVDEAFGKASIYENNIAPATFPRVFDYGEIATLHLRKKGLIHGEQAFYYERPLVVGEEVYCYTKVEDYFEKKGKSGLMGFLKLQRIGEDRNGKVIF